MIAALLFSTLSLLAGPTELFNQGVESFKSGDFKGAIDAWTGVLSEGVEDPRVYYNLGNAYFRDNQPGRAVLSYERALRLDPLDRQTRENLEFVRLRLKDRFDTTGGGPYARFLHFLDAHASVRTLSWIFLVLVLILNFLWTAALLRREKSFRTLVTFVASVLVAILLLVGPALGYRLYKTHLVEEGVILSPAVTARSAPQDDGTELFVAHEGTRVRLWESVGEWRRVTLPNGLTGFIPADAVETI